MPQARSRDALRDLVATHSDAIAACRVLCIVPVAYVHIAMGEGGSPVGAAVQGVLRDLLGRSSVLLLSVVSGLLMVHVFSSRSWGAASWGRVRGLLVPMVAWNAIALGVMLALRRPMPVGLVDVGNALFAISGHGVTRPLTFLRDLFVVSLATPLLVLGIRRMRLWLLIPVVLAGGFVSTKPWVAHSQIVSYYALGVGFGVLHLERLRLVRFAARAAPWLLAALVVVCAARPLTGDTLSFIDTNAFDALVRRPVCAGSFGVLAMRVCAHEPSCRLIRRWLEPAIFAMFLSHALVLRGLRGLAFCAGVDAPAARLAAWIVLPFLSLAVAVLLQQLLRRGPDMLYRVLLGKPRP
ncbi:MAG: acyltransferase family protein [Nannocystaceae bacterium]|nr:acyltransferase family protein [Nannocystaceae bacterium]